MNFADLQRTIVDRANALNPRSPFFPAGLNVQSASAASRAFTPAVNLNRSQTFLPASALAALGFTPEMFSQLPLSQRIPVAAAVLWNTGRIAEARAVDARIPAVLNFAVDFNR
jgi:hypothetical protein